MNYLKKLFGFQHKKTNENKTPFSTQEKLIPDLRQHAETGSLVATIEDWIIMSGSMQLAIGYSCLFWPDFVEYKGCVFLKFKFSEDTFHHWKEKVTVENVAQIEYLINHIHIVDLFSRRGLLSKEQVVFLGNKLREMYRAKLSIDFPDRAFEIEFDFIDNPENLEDYQLTFYQTDSA